MSGQEVSEQRLSGRGLSAIMSVKDFNSLKECKIISASVYLTSAWKRFTDKGEQFISVEITPHSIGDNIFKISLKKGD